MSAWKVPADEKRLMFDFLSHHQRISYIDVDDIMKQITAMVDQMSIAI